MQSFINIIEFIVGIGVFINAILFIPQIVKLIKWKSAESISLLTFIGFDIINMLLVIHGLIRHDNILFFGYMLSVVANSFIVTLIIKYRYFDE
ncbi:MAG TPA: PQ-loop domain-containing transporter [Aquella sp.]|nr:PQ-loop domain-containing transporter [Aquella sp.]